MIVSPEEYNSMLHSLHDPNEYLSFLTRIPKDEPIYEIDLATREIHIPELLSVEQDHNSEIIWFKVNRFYDNYDLYNANCWIQYRNAVREEYYYSAPMIIGSREDFSNDVILIPWAIGQFATKKAGTIEFAFQFFKISEDNKSFLFKINTKTAKGKILHGLQADPLKVITSPEGTDGEFIPERKALAEQINLLYERVNQLEKDYELYWIQV